MKHVYGLVLVLGTVVFAGCGAGSVEEQNEEGVVPELVTIGAIGPLTGGAATYGVPTQRATELLLPEINERLAAAGKPSVEIVWQDAKCTGQDAVLGAQALLAQHDVPFILGGVCSNETLSVAPLANAEEVVLLTPISKSPAIREAGEYVFRLNVSSDAFGPLVGEYVNGKYETIVALTEDLDFPVGTEESLAANFAGELESERYPSTTVDFRSLLGRVQLDGPDAVMLNPQTLEKFELILSQMEEAEYFPPLVVNELIGGSPLAIERLEAYPAEVVSAVFSPVKGERYDALLVAYQNQYEEEPTYNDALIFPVDALMILEGIVMEHDFSASSLDGASIRAALDALPEYSGLAGTYGFDEDGEATLRPELVVLGGGE